MSKQDMFKVQTCVLKVNIHCDCEGCMHKVKKSLQKVGGVYKVSIDAAQGRVVVSGNADPATLIRKLEKAGKHAELWGPPQKGGGGAAAFPISMEQLKKLQMESFSKGNNQKKGNHEQPQMMKNGFVQLPMKKGGGKEEKFAAKDHHKSVRFELPEHDDDDDDFDDDDDEDFDDEFDDEDDFEDEFGEVESHSHHSKPFVKGGGGGGGGQKQSKAAGNPSKGDKGGGKVGKEGKDGKAKKGGGGGIDMFFKGMLKKAGGKKGKSGKGNKKRENKEEEGGGGKNGGGKKGGFELGDGKKGKNDDGNWSKKSGENFHGGKHQHHQQGFNEMKPNHKGGGGGGGGGGRNMEMMGGFPAVAGLPAMNGGRFPGAGPPGMNPYSQQQMMMNQMMMMNQQREHGHGHEGVVPAYYAKPPPAMSYGGPPPHMGYGGPPPQHMGYGGPPPPASGEYAHMFSDENTDSCGIM